MQESSEVAAESRGLTSGQGGAPDSQDNKSEIMRPSEARAAPERLVLGSRELARTASHAPPCREQPTRQLHTPHPPAPLRTKSASAI
jgi:hypothetical protein